MLVRALRSFVPATGNPVNAGDVFALPPGVDWLDCGLCAKAEKGEEATVAVEPARGASKPHAQLRANLTEILRARKPKEASPANVELAARQYETRKRERTARAA